MDDDARFDSTDTKRTLSQNLIAGVLCAFLCPVLANQGVAERRAVTVTDTIQMSKFANPIGENLEDVVEFSPDRRKFVVVIRKGDIAANLIRYSMLLWTLDGSNASQSNVLATMSSSSNRPGIERVSWLDNSTVVFLGEGPGQSHQLYSLDVTTGKMAQLTKHSTNILYYAVTRSGRTIAFVAESASQPLFNESALRNGLIVDDKRRLAAGVDNLISGQVGGALSYPELYVQTAGGKSKRIPTHGVIQMFGGGTHIALSPGGGYLVMTLRVENAPVEWQEYSNAWIQRAAKEPVPDGGYSALMTYVLINTETGENRALLNVPVGFGFKVAWSPDGNAVVIGETFLPLATTAGVERQTRRSQTVAAEIAVRDGRATVISSDNLRLDTWDPDTGCVWFERGSTLDFAEGRPAATREKVCFKKRNGNWAPVPMKPGNHMEIAVEQDSNTSPRLYAAQEGTRSKFLLFDPNPQFQGLKFGKVEEITLREGQKEIRAGLYYPVDYIPGKRYPLVIQTHGWSNKQFWIDGPFTTAFAAQALAGRGVMVVQLSFLDEDKAGTVDEAPLESSQFDRIVEHLDGRGLIDPRRVGVIGFSRTCFHVKFALTHSQLRFAAASVTEGFDGGYIGYVLSAPTFNQDIEAVNGGPPFGKTFNLWLERAPDLNLPKVNTPLLITSLTPADAVYDWEWFGVLKLLGKPADMIVLKDGSHVLERPWDRMISQQGTVDWFCFWLKGEEDPGPGKTEQYLRWRKLRDAVRH